ncbi:MAG: beta-galactosidase, partial [Thermoguttaceae bacterium]|nr:beta-galactosidase [Thermoguttaceae bacterium]
MSHFYRKLASLVILLWGGTLVCDFVFGQEKQNVARPAVEKFAVESVQGVPMITLDGVPTRARIFWGRADTGLSINVTSKETVIDFPYTPQFDAEKHGTFHFRFGKKPGTVIIDDFSILDEKTGQYIAGPYSFDSQQEFADNWNFYHTTIDGKKVADIEVKKVPEKDSSALVISLQDATGLNSDFHIYHQHNLDLNPQGKYRIHFTIQSDIPRSVTLGIYRPGNPYLPLGGTISSESHLGRQTKMAADADVHFVSFLFGNCWKTEDGRWDWSVIDSYCDSILAVNPKAMLIPRPGMDAPKWWVEQNPDEQMRWKDTQEFTLPFGEKWASPASLKYRQEACEALASMIDHLEAKYGSSIAGYHPYGQNTGEWFTANTWGAGLSGYGVAELDSWRRWLKKKYHTDENLQSAWGDKNVTLETAEVPSPELRREVMTSPFLDPKTDPRHQSLLDLNIWMQQEMTDTVLALAKTVRERTHGKKLSLFFYGYSFEFGNVSKGPAASAHYNMRALLDSPDIDIICSP